MDAPLPTTAGAGSTTVGEDEEEDGFPLTAGGNDMGMLGPKRSICAGVEEVMAWRDPSPGPCPEPFGFAQDRLRRMDQDDNAGRKMDAQ